MDNSSTAKEISVDNHTNYNSCAESAPLTLPPDSVSTTCRPQTTSTTTTTNAHTTPNPSTTTVKQGNGSSIISSKHNDVAASEGACEKYTSCRWVLGYVAACMHIAMITTMTNLPMALVCISKLEYVLAESGMNASSLGRDGGDVGGGGWDVFDNFTAATTTLAVEEGEWTRSVLNGTTEDGGDGDDGVTVIKPDYIPPDMQGVVLSAFYYGYGFTHLIGGMMAQRFGSKHVVTFTMTLSATLTLLMPVAIRFNVIMTVALRVLLGLVSGIITPAMTTLWIAWAPLDERAKLVTLSSSGANLGVAIGNLVSGFLCSIQVDEGWPFIFYVIGAFTFLSVIVWQLLVYDTPEKHPRIQSKERLLIRSKTVSVSSVKKTAKPPIKAMLTSPAFLSLLLTQLSYVWASGVLANYLPIFLNDILHFDTKTNGVLSSLPFIFRLTFSGIFAILSDCVTHRRWLNITTSRKVFQSVGLVMPAVLIVGVGFLDPHLKYLAVAMMVAAAASQSACYAGFRINALDIAPRFTGTVVGITMTFSTSANIISPLIVSSLTADKKEESWRTAFILTAAISIIGAVVFVIFGSAEEQDWAKVKLPSRASTSASGTNQDGGTSFVSEARGSMEIEVEAGIPENGYSVGKGQLNLAYSFEDGDQKGNKRNVEITKSQ